MTPLPRLALLCTLALAAAHAPAAPPLPDDKRQALAEFVVAYRLADAWPQMAPKIARDSLPRLEDATHADLDADELAAYTAYEIYAKYFETEEIRQISAFFGSPTGRKLTDLSPTILAESRKPQAGNVMANHFSEQELAEIDAFWNSPTGQKMHASAEQIREDMHAHFIERSEAALQAVARQLASKAEADAAPKP